LRFLTIGLGHCGGKIADDFKRAAIDKKGMIMDVCAINSDVADLSTHRNIPAENKLLIGSGKGAAKNWQEGREAAIQSRTNIKALASKLLSSDTDIILFTLGEGGGTGSGVAPIMAEIIGELGRTCISIVTLPFETESVKAKVNASMGIDLLYRHEAVKAIICIENDKLTAHFPDKLLTEAYEKVNETAVQTFLDLIDLANLPSRADRIDESELVSIFEYPGFATLANFQTPANMVEDVAATLRRSWNTSLFAEVDPSSASGVIFGVQGPTHLFTTLQVDAIRRTLHELLAGKDAMLGIYPSEHMRWASYIGILTGMDVPKKLGHLVESAKAEYQHHEQVLEAKAKSKKEGLGFKLREQKGESKATQPRSNLEPEGDKLERLASTVVTGRPDLGKNLPKTLQIISSRKGEKLSLEELVSLIQTETDIDDERSAVAAILQLQNLGFLVEVRKNLFHIA
jgi:cell division protein FtsZ